MIKISVNNQITELAKPQVLSDFLEDTQNSSQNASYAVAINGEFIPRSVYSSTTIDDGDEIDIVHPIGGG